MASVIDSIYSDPFHRDMGIPIPSPVSPKCSRNTGTCCASESFATTASQFAEPYSKIPTAGCCPDGNRITFVPPEELCGDTIKYFRSVLNYVNGVGEINPIKALEPYPRTDQMYRLCVGRTIESLTGRSEMNLQFAMPYLTDKFVVPKIECRSAQCEPADPFPCSKKKKKKRKSHCKF